MTRYVIFTDEEIQTLLNHGSVTEWDPEGNRTIYISEDGYRAFTEPADPNTPVS